MPGRCIRPIAWPVHRVDTHGAEVVNGPAFSRPYPASGGRIHALPYFGSIPFGSRPAGPSNRFERRVTESIRGAPLNCPLARRTPGDGAPPVGPREHGTVMWRSIAGVATAVGRPADGPRARRHRLPVVTPPPRTARPLRHPLHGVSRRQVHPPEGLLYDDATGRAATSLVAAALAGRPPVASGTSCCPRRPPHLRWRRPRGVARRLPARSRKASAFTHLRHPLTPGRAARRPIAPASPEEVNCPLWRQRQG